MVASTDPIAIDKGARVMSAVGEHLDAKAVDIAQRGVVDAASGSAKIPGAQGVAVQGPIGAGARQIDTRQAPRVRRLGLLGP